MTFRQFLLWLQLGAEEPDRDDAMLLGGFQKPVACTVPFTEPGGKPVIALPGKIPTLPVILVGPVFVIVEPARITKGPALRRCTTDVAGRIGDEESPSDAELPNEPGPGTAGVELPALHATAEAVKSKARINLMPGYSTGKRY